MGAYYSNTIARFLDDNTNRIIGTLTHKSGLSGFHQQLHTQTLAWEHEIEILRSSLGELIISEPKAENWNLLLEYPIARREKRIDAVLIANNIIIVIEFKLGKSDYSAADRDQVLDYCLDLRDFHYESRNKIIVPFLLATAAKNINNAFADNNDLVQNIVLVNQHRLSDTILSVVARWGDNQTAIDPEYWDNSDYNPTPSIIEAAKQLYAGKSVAEISRSHARKVNLTKTSKTVIDAIKQAKADHEKVICFITGIPGAGKTLAGLNIAHDALLQSEEGSLATFLSGNSPLIKVLKKALSDDAFSKIKKNDVAAREKETSRIISFIENVHGFFAKHYIEENKTPNNKVVIFDEAQRAWDAAHSLKEAKRDCSEAEAMLRIMDRHKDWAVIVALVGGGQEINNGEAGLPEWGRVIEKHFDNWKVYISPQLKSGDHSTGDLTLFKDTPSNLKIVENDDLHLQVSVRSYKAENLSKWVSLILNNDPLKAKELFDKDLTRYKITLTRDLDTAKKWLRTQCKGTRRMGLVATSGARRLLPYGFDIRQPLEEAEWFLNGRDDIRSSYYLELAATEYRIQGLELDWAGVCWDLDLRRKNTAWDFRKFKGTLWGNVNKEENQQFLINKYRVLLTRAREGMVIFIPPGDITDHTRPPAEYDEVANYLISCGVKQI